MRRKITLCLIGLFGLMVAVTPGLAEVRLVMFDQPGCIYCQRWTAEVGDAYAVTDEGKRAPLWRIDIRDELPSTIVLKHPAVYTPTFVLLDDAHREVARIEGYPGEDFFWGLLNSMLNELQQTQGD